jgi:NTP pyrophosphatase (non-canonical NTP hydrolase)
MKTSEKVLNWAKNKDLLKPENIKKQFSKLKEEVGELAVEINENNLESARMELGDCLVVLEILANQLETTAKKCKKLAYNKIKSRTGKTIDGKFIKDAK